jgi:hypothetical protein
MTPSIIVHIGPPKTATTSLQIALEEIEVVRQIRTAC